MSPKRRRRQAATLLFAPPAIPDIQTLVEEHARPAYRLALGIVRDPALAEDVVQETMVKVWRSVESFRGEGSLRSWVLRIAHNTAVSMLRGIREVAVPDHELPEVVQEIGPERTAAGRMGVEALQRTLDVLDETSRAIVVLRELEGLTYEEIASTLEIPVTTVKTRLFRARRRLEHAMEEWT